jgi:translocation and assembly module TamA
VINAKTGATPIATATRGWPFLFFFLTCVTPVGAQSAAPVPNTPVNNLSVSAAPSPIESKVSTEIKPALTPEGKVGTKDAEPEVSAFDIEVRAPEPFKSLLEQHMELKRYRAVTDLDDAELARLLQLATNNVRNLIATLGYFSPKVVITRETAASGRPTIVVGVEPGVLTLVAKTDFLFTGDINNSNDPDVQAQRQTIENNWRLPPGQSFTQQTWDGAKTQALRDLVVRRYPAGRLSQSLADIDAPMRSANLSLTLDSGPLYRLGEMQVSGIKRYNPVLVPRLARLNPGDIYDQQALLQAQQRLAASGYFDSVTVFINPDDTPEAVPVQVQVREAKQQKVVLGVGASTDNGPRLSLEHSNLRVPGTDWQAVTKLQLEQKSPSLQTEWTGLPDLNNWRWQGLARVDRIEDASLMTKSERLRFGQLQLGDQIDRNIYLQFDRARVTGINLMQANAAESGSGSAISGNFIWTGRYFDDQTFPSRGYGVGLELGGGVTLTEKRLPYLRSVGRWLGFKPLSTGRIAMRAQAGAVLANADAAIPSSALFRTGGDSTVRGYGLRDIGVDHAGVVGPGRYMAVASIEWQRPLRRKGLPTEFENTFFMDVGAVGDKPQDFSPAIGIGTGLRWKSPIGPLQIDLAYGVKSKQIRLHTSVGFVF